MNNIKVEYDGDYPNACSGTLKIWVDDKLIYEKMHCCTSGGSVSFTEDWDEVVTRGKLVWDDAKDFSKEIQAAVKKELSKVHVCCGGCV